MESASASSVRPPSKKRAIDAEDKSRCCPVCCESFTLATRREVTCSNCDYIACVSCNKTFLLNLDDDPRCMNCNHPWNREFLEAFPKTWVNGELAKHREKVLVDRELSRLPDSQHLVQNYKTAEALRQTIAKEKEERVALYRRLHEIETNRWNLFNRLQRMKESNYDTDGLRLDGGDSQGSVRRSFVCRCPDEECRGFLSTQYKCGLCNKFACPECHEIIGESRTDAHECDPRTVETVQLLKKDSKPCPSCGTTIFKIDGCDQMWCTECHTAFSWRNGVVVRGTIHNPHYFAYMRSRAEGGAIPRQPGDVPEGCNERARFTLWDLERAIGKVPAVGSQDGEIIVHKKALSDVLRLVTHIREVDMRTAALRDPGDGALLVLRRRYLMGEIDLEGWRRGLLLNEKKRERIESLRQVYDMLCMASEDILRNVTPEKDSLTRTVEELAGLFSYTAEALDRVSKRFGCSVPRKAPDMETILNGARDYVQRSQENRRRRLARGAPTRTAFVDLTVGDS